MGSVSGKHSMYNNNTTVDGRNSSISPADFKLGMRRLASGVVLIATECDGERFGLTATAVMSISADPPTLMICVNRSASAHEALSRSGCFTVNLLGGEDRAIADLFSSSKHRAQRFSDREWGRLTTGAPVLLGSLASFDCRIVQTLPSPSHTLYFGEVIDLKMFTDEINPLLYWNGSYHSEQGST
jgi:flavin reductase